MDVTRIIEHIERIAPPEAQAPWDRSGLQAAGVSPAAGRLAVGLDPTPGFTTAALDWGADFLLTHHPLYLEPKPLDAPGPFLDAARAVLAAGAWLYSAHTSLDANPAGPAGWLARGLGLSGLTALEPTGEGLGIGQVGSLPAPLAWDDFVRALAALAPRDFWTLAGEPPGRVERAAVCPGSGGSLVSTARAAGAQVLVTGDLKYHQALDARHPATGLCVVDVGHFSLEEEMTRLLAAALDAELAPAGVEVRFFPARDPLAALRPAELR
ncbi:MAG: Nif3-like dinuclear metal center hexameric protein [Thermodesulfobacteriota bacterium]